MERVEKMDRKDKIEKENEAYFVLLIILLLLLVESRLQRKREKGKILDFSSGP